MKRGFEMELLDDVIRMLSKGKSLPEKITTTHYLADGQSIGNAISKTIGCLCTGSKMMFSY